MSSPPSVPACRLTPWLVVPCAAQYLSLMRALQLRYWLEPAGSHGVWGLDDYQFLPFVFGAAQLAGHKYLRPKSIHTPDVLAQFQHDYLYFQAVQVSDPRTRRGRAQGVHHSSGTLRLVSRTRRLSAVHGDRSDKKMCFEEGCNSFAPQLKSR